MNNNTPKKNLEINNNIKLVIDFNQNLKILDIIKKYTDIKHILLIDAKLAQSIIEARIIKKFSILFVNILILCNIFKNTIYIDKQLLNEMSETEKNILFYLQYINEIKIIQL